MAKDRLLGKLAVILHADVAGSTALVQQDEQLAHERIQDAFRRFSDTIKNYQGNVLELRGDALLAEFERPSDAVAATLAFQADHIYLISRLKDDLRPTIRVGIAMGEVVIADGTITGAGVILAQRVEQLADPGGLCITAALHEALPKRMPFDLENLGEQVLKGFDDPVRVYRVELSEGQSVPAPQQYYQHEASSKKPKLIVAIIVIALVVVGGAAYWFKAKEPRVEAASLERMAFPLPDKPSIAVLPFTNMSSDAEQEYFSDGITEDIITDLSKISGLFVVARNSTFTYKGQAVKIRQVAEELGVRYVLEGSVRRSQEKIRITAQLIDALKGNHIWAERYDRELKDVFSVQSEVARQVAKVLAVTLKANENERLFQKYTTSIDAYDVFLQARRAVDAPTKDNILRGEKLFSRVIELDPNFAGGYAGLSFNYSVQVRFQYSTSPSTHLARAFELANKAIEVDGSYAWGYIALAGAHLANGDAATAVDAMRQALTLEPNGYEANLFMGFYLQFAGEADLAVEHLLLARRLSPVVSVRDLAFMGNAQFMNGNYAEVVRLNSERDRKFPGRWSPSRSVVIAATYTLLERPEEAAAIVKELLDTHPNFNLSQWKFGKLWKSEVNRAHLYNAAKKAGIPEFPND
jgi:TolB-like protein/class 3 adenylate cyclase